MTTNATLETYGFSFPTGTRVVQGTGEDDELWVLVNPGEEKPDDWNYWIIMDQPDNVRPWKLREIVRHWGRYLPPAGMVFYVDEPLPSPPQRRDETPPSSDSDIPTLRGLRD